MLIIKTLPTIEHNGGTLYNKTINTAHSYLTNENLKIIIIITFISNRFNINKQIHKY